MAKPAEQTPLVAARAVALLHEAGIPLTALHLVPGDGKVGENLVADPRVAGIAFTGSTEVGRAINRALAAKSGPIVPLIAETGGINAMIVDATALPEQVVDDVIASAFRSAGQRCSALRLLCLQEDVAERMLDMLIGAARELTVGDPREPATHVGPVIDADAKTKLESWIAAMERAGAGRVRFRWDRDHALPARGTYVAPTIVELDRARDLKEEVFGPVLHVVRWRAEELDALLDEIAANGTALTLGIHSRIDLTIDRIAARLAQRQRLRQSQHDRRRGRHPAVRRHPAFRHRPEGGRAELFAPLRDRAGRHHQYGRRGRQRQPAGAGRVIEPANPAGPIGIIGINTIAT